jgi:hypothetical protein
MHVPPCSWHGQTCACDDVSILAVDEYIIQPKAQVFTLSTLNKLFDVLPAVECANKFTACGGTSEKASIHVSGQFRYGCILFANCQHIFQPSLFSFPKIISKATGKAFALDEIPQQKCVLTCSPVQRGFANNAISIAG